MAMDGKEFERQDNVRLLKMEWSKLMNQVQRVAEAHEQVTGEPSVFELEAEEKLRALALEHKLEVDLD